MNNKKIRVEKRLRNLEMLIRLQLVVIIALLIGLCAFATNIYHATELGEAIQAVEAETQTY
jgi:hypothetical protein